VSGFSCSNDGVIAFDTVSVIKHSAAIHMANSLTLSERKIYNALLYFARPSLIRGVDHVVDMAVLEGAVGFTRNNRNYLVSIAESLREKTVRYNIFGKDKSHDEVWCMNSGLLSEIGFTDNNSKCRYSFPNSLIDLLRDPSLYARINLGVQTRINGQHTLPLYEFYLDMLGGRRGVTEFSFSIVDLRALLDIGEAYTEFKVLNRDVIQKAHVEINSKADIRVDVLSLMRTGRRVTALRLRVTRTTKAAEDSDCIIEDRAQTAGERAVDGDDIEIRLLEVFGKAKIVSGIIRDYVDVDYIRANLDYAKQMHARGKVKNLAAYVMKALKDDYRPGGRKSCVAPMVERAVAPVNEIDAVMKPQQRVERGRAAYDSLSDEEKQAVRFQFEKTGVFLGLKSMLGKKIKEDSPLYTGSLFSFVADSMQA